MNPSPETKTREELLSNPKNIFFLFDEAQLIAENIDLKELFHRFDQGSKGYLLFNECSEMICSLNSKLNAMQIARIIRDLDEDRDGYITLPEMQHCLEAVQEMGAPGSNWKMYIDPAEDVICYHNFSTHEKILEYEMTDKYLKVINLENIFAEAEYHAQAELKTLRTREWKRVLENYMTKRIQFMFRYWKGKQLRNRFRWRVVQREHARKTKLQRKIVEFVIKYFLGKKTRKSFKRQLSFTIEMIVDCETTKTFYFNHQTNTSHWELPLLLRRPAYADALTVSPATEWIPLLDNNNNNNNNPKEQQQSQEEQRQLYSAWFDTTRNNNNNNNHLISYYHVKSRRTFPGKPDGFPLCSQCYYFLAIRKCLECDRYYCFSCHRTTHGNPFHFHQKQKARKREYSDPDFVARIYQFQHRWEVAVPRQCDLCHGAEKLRACFHCADCGANRAMCRICFKRIHSHEMKPPHRYYYI
jgi:hypothetical protein